MRCVAPELLALTCAGLLACGGVEDPGAGAPPADPTPPPAMPPPEPTNPVGQPIRFVMEPFEIAPGTERQVCKRVNLPAGTGLDVVRLHSTMSGTSHHFNVYKVLGADATAQASPQEAVVHDCPPASDQLGGGAAYIFGASSPEKYYDTPTGVAFHLKGGHQLILEQHVINASNKPIQGQVTFDLVQAAPDAKIDHRADVLWLANWGIYLPAGKKTSATTHCTVAYDLEIYNLWSHTHSLGVHFSIEKWTREGTTHLYDSSDWEHPNDLRLLPTVRLKAGEGLQWTCTWMNTRPKTVIAGRDSTDEMCIAFGAAYPTSMLEGDPISCNKFF